MLEEEETAALVGAEDDDELAEPVLSDEAVTFSAVVPKKLKCQ